MPTNTPILNSEASEAGEIAAAVTGSLTRKGLPVWVQKVLGWFIIGVLTMFSTTAVVQYRVSAVEQRQNKIEEQTIPTARFDQFERDLKDRLDHMDKKLDRLDDHLNTRTARP